MHQGFTQKLFGTVNNWASSPKADEQHVAFSYAKMCNLAPCVLVLSIQKLYVSMTNETSKDEKNLFPELQAP